MKFLLLTLLFVVSSSLVSQTSFHSKLQPVSVSSEEEAYDDLEEMPVFPGGPEAMQKYLDKNINHPETMRGVCSERKLIAIFVVEKNGSLTDIDILKSINGCPDFDYEVLRVIKTMPKWIPGKLEGRNVRCLYKMPVYIN